MDTMQSIVAGTKTSAEALGMSHQIGTIEKNKLADMIATPGDPLKDITELQRVSFIMLGGREIINKWRGAC